MPHERVYGIPKGKDSHNSENQDDASIKRHMLKLDSKQLKILEDTAKEYNISLIEAYKMYFPPYLGDEE
jgi:hypothetical protein